MGNFFHRAVSCYARVNGFPKVRWKFMYRLHELCVSLLLAEDLLRVWSQISEGRKTAFVFLPRS